MKHLIQALRSLQEVDRQRMEAEKERRTITDRVEQLANMLAELEREQAEKKDKLREAERWYGEREKELKEDSEKIKKAQAKLNTITKAKEYVAVQREIEALKRSHATKEEEILKLLAVMDEFKQAVEEDAKKLEKMREEMAREDQATGARVLELDEKIKRLEKEYAKHEKSIPQDILKKYKRIQEAWHGLAVVPVNSKGSCGGCHRQVPPQLCNILLRQNSLETCPYCHRFIYIEVDEEGNPKDS